MPVPRLEFGPPITPAGNYTPDLKPRDKWRLRAACGDSDTALFFPTENDEPAIAAAKAVCATCPVRDKCLEFALVTRQDDGVWGGLDENERRSVRRRNMESYRRRAAGKKKG